jgi:hypothetical protein
MMPFRIMLLTKPCLPNNRMTASAIIKGGAMIGNVAVMLKNRFQGISTRVTA